MALLNSIYINFIYKQLFFGWQITIPALEILPISKISKESQKPFENLVNQILQKKEQNEDTTNLENQIDLMVYKLYELTYEEIIIVDAEFDKILAEFGLSKEDYEKMSVEELGKL